MGNQLFTKRCLDFFWDQHLTIFWLCPDGLFSSVLRTSPPLSAMSCPKPSGAILYPLNTYWQSSVMWDRCHWTWGINICKWYIPVVIRIEWKLPPGVQLRVALLDVVFLEEIHYWGWVSDNQARLMSLVAFWIWTPSFLSSTMSICIPPCFPSWW